MTASVAFYAQGAEIACQPLNCVPASALQVYRYCSCKESSDVLVMLQDVPEVR